MAVALIPDDAVGNILRNGIGDADWTVDLFANNFTPGRSDLIGAYTLATYPGYVQVTWTWPPTTVVASKGNVTPRTVSFPAPSSGSPVDVYGFVVRFTDRRLGSVHVLMAARFAGAPITLTVGDPDLVFSAFFRDLDASL